MLLWILLGCALPSEAMLATSRILPQECSEGAHGVRVANPHAWAVVFAKMAQEHRVSCETILQRGIGALTLRTFHPEVGPPLEPSLLALYKLFEKHLLPLGDLRQIQAHIPGVLREKGVDWELWHSEHPCDVARVLDLLKRKDPPPPPAFPSRGGGRTYEVSQGVATWAPGKVTLSLRGTVSLSDLHLRGGMTAAQFEEALKNGGLPHSTGRKATRSQSNCLP